MHRLRIAIFVFIIFGTLFAMFSRAETKKSEKTLQDLFHAIAVVESNEDDSKIGDGGKAIGRYQIHESYWLDADMPDGTYQDCKKKEYAERVILSYWQKYCPEAVRNRDFKKLSRVHHGGPTGHQKESTLKYWEKIQMELNR